MQILNLGSGTKTSTDLDVTNVDWSIYLRLKRRTLGRWLAPLLLRGTRKERFERLPPNTVAHDLSKGIPFPDGSVDVVYHSHLLEHLDRPVASEFMGEVRRVLKPGGVQRVVVPDLERLCRDLLEHLERCSSDPDERAAHDEYVAELIEQSVRREAYGMRGQRGPWRAVERLLVGDARRRGETHQWLYDRANLSALLERTGFAEIAVRSFDTSRIEDWQRYGLDLDASGREYKPGSLYVEAVRPA